VIVSPLLPKSVDHAVYDHSSVLATLEWLFGVPPLTRRDANANMIQGVTSAATLRTDCPEKLNVPAAQPQKSRLTDAERAARDLEPVPDRSSLVGFLGVLLKADSQLSATPAGRAAAIARFQSIRTRGDARVYLREVMAKVQAEKVRRGL
jgi:phospholipase C